MMRFRVLIAIITLLAVKVSVYPQNKSLNGTWVLDSVQVIKHSDKSVADINQFKKNPSIALFDKVMFQGEELTITKNGISRNGKVQVFGNTITFPAIFAPIKADYKIKDDILLLEQRITQPDSDTYIVLIQYKKK